MKYFNSWIILRKQFFAKFVVLGLTLVLLSYISVKVFSNELLTGVFLISVIGLLISGNFFKKKYFYKKTVIEIYSSGIKFSILSGSESHIDIVFNEVLWFSVEVINPRFYSITFKLKSGNKKEYSLPQMQINKNDDDAIKIIDSINEEIANNNRVKDETDKTILRPSFYATQTGFSLIVVLLVLSLIAFALNVFIVPKASFFGFIATTFAIIQMIIKRKNSLSLFNNLKVAHHYK